MANTVRSARGEMIDIELLTIKAALARTPVSQKVVARKEAIAEKDGVKVQIEPAVTEFLKESAKKTAPKRK